MPHTIDLIAGARPNFMKIAPILRALRTLPRGPVPRLIHTGQHYDANMSEAFFRQLNLPAPDVNFEVGSGSQAEQTGAVMRHYEQWIARDPAALCLVVGDVTSTLACAITARKAGLAVAHVEGGLRSGDWRMPEEINRRVTDAVSNFFFTTSELANHNLRAEGVEDSRIHFVGNTMIDSLAANLDRLRPPDFAAALGLRAGEYFVLTLHRPANVDQAGTFHRMLLAVLEATRGLPVIFPVHPRTRPLLKEISLPSGHALHAVDPQPYLEFNHLVRHARAVITDSGGITEETTWLGVPCFTLRDNTERPETVSIGTNTLVGTDPAQVKPALDALFAGAGKRGGIPPLWDGRAGERIAAKLAEILGDAGAA
jgi:UDP-N-acetylglucosamine 2-epimerase (non-hydrolysing)